jgi:glycosyltransferase involved in cell wall biosynthesis
MDRRFPEQAIFVTEAYYTKQKLYGVSGHVQIPLKAACLLAEKAGRIDLITTKPPGAEHLMVATPEGVHIQLVAHATKPWPEAGVYLTTALRQVAQLARLVAARRYRIVHFFGGPKTGMLAALIKVLNPRTRIVYSPLSAPDLPDAPLRQRLFRAAFRRLDLIVSTTEFVSRRWGAIVGDAKVQVARPGVLKQMRPPAAEAQRDSVVFWRNADFENGADLMVEAVRQLAPRFPAVRFVFALRAGSEFEPSALELARVFDNVVTYVQPYPDGLTIEAILARALFVVAPFRQLSINPQMAILETLHAGVPVVASDVESNSEVVVHGVTGLLLERCDASSIIRATERLLGDPDLLRALSGNAERVTRASFNWTDFEARLAAIHGL